MSIFINLCFKSSLPIGEIDLTFSLEVTMESCLDYHLKTAHTYESVRRPHYLDWSNYPSPFKFYRGVKTFPLPPFKFRGQETLDTLYRLCSDYGSDSLTLQEVANLAFSMNGVTKVEDFHGEPFAFRASPSAGALYPFELYLFLRSVEGLPDGLYHYQPVNHSLELLVAGDLFEPLKGALCAEFTGNCVAVVTTIYGRSAWKYRARAYRYCLLDSGHMVANGVAYLRSLGLDATAVSLFKDSRLNALLGVDGTREFATVALLPERPALFWGDEELPPFNYPPSEPVLRRPVREPLVEEAHRAGELADCQFYRPFPGSSSLFPEVTSPPLGDVILKRRSRREFTGRAMPFETFKHLAESSLTCFPSDWGFPKCNLYLQVRNVEGLQSGIYTPSNGRLELVQAGDFGPYVSYLCLSQRFVAYANVNVVFTYSFGGTCRDYRGALLEAGALGENLYLAAEAFGCGACGIGAFYDLELQAFLGLPPEELPVYVVSVGVLV